jgi:hypothetical protein
VRRAARIPKNHIPIKDAVAQSAAKLLVSPKIERSGAGWSSPRVLNLRIAVGINMTTRQTAYTRRNSSLSRDLDVASRSVRSCNDTGASFSVVSDERVHAACP